MLPIVILIKTHDAPRTLLSCSLHTWHWVLHSFYLYIVSFIYYQIVISAYCTPRQGHVLLFTQVLFGTQSWRYPTWESDFVDNVVQAWLMCLYDISVLSSLPLEYCHRSGRNVLSIVSITWPDELVHLCGCRRRAARQVCPLQAQFWLAVFTPTSDMPVLERI